jgi:hypothetical protein
MLHQYVPRKRLFQPRTTAVCGNGNADRTPLAGGRVGGVRRGLRNWFDLANPLPVYASRPVEIDASPTRNLTRLDDWETVRQDVKGETIPVHRDVGGPKVPVAGDIRDQGPKLPENELRKSRKRFRRRRLCPELVPDTLQINVEDTRTALEHHKSVNPGHS